VAFAFRATASGTQQAIDRYRIWFSHVNDKTARRSDGHAVIIGEIMAQRHLTQAEINTLLVPTFALGSPLTITGAATAGGLINLTITAHGLVAGSVFAPLWGSVKLVGGTVEANGFWALTVADANHITLIGSTFTNAYTSGGTLTVVSLTGGTAAGLIEDDLNNLAESVSRGPSAPGSTIGSVLLLAP
jgi:hypothetical protein